MESNKFFFFVAHMSLTTSEVGHWTIVEVASPISFARVPVQRLCPGTAVSSWCAVFFVSILFFWERGKTVRGRDLVEWRS